MEGPPGPETVIDGRRYIYFGGTSYLGLHAAPEVIEAACEGARRYGIHTATSRRGYGTNPPTLEVEQTAAAFFGTADAFYFVSGYMGTAVLLHALADAFDVVLADEHCHFGMLEAASLTRRPLERFRHRDPEDLRRRLREHVPAPARVLVLTDGVFAALGTLAPVDDYLAVLDTRPGSMILVDDAHGVGTLGAYGRGTLEHLGLWNRGINADHEEGPVGPAKLYLCATLSKALGGFGGIVPGTESFLCRVRGASHYFDAASAPPSPAAAASARALELVMARPELRERLRDNVARLRAGLRALGLAVEDGPSPIIAFNCGPAGRMQELHDALRRRGYLVPFVRSYAGVGPEGVLRVAACAGHTDAMIDGLLGELRELL